MTRILIAGASGLIGRQSLRQTARRTRCAQRTRRIGGQLTVEHQLIEKPAPARQAARDRTRRLTGAHRPRDPAPQQRLVQARPVGRGRVAARVGLEQVAQQDQIGPIAGQGARRISPLGGQPPEVSGDFGRRCHAGQVTRRDKAALAVSAMRSRNAVPMPA